MGGTLAMMSRIIGNTGKVCCLPFLARAAGIVKVLGCSGSSSSLQAYVADLGPPAGSQDQ